MASAQFEWVGGEACLDFTNTVSWNRQGPTQERLRSYSDLLAWAIEAEMLPDPRRLREGARCRPRMAAATLARAHRLRGMLHDLFLGIARGKGPGAARLRDFNRALSGARGHLRVESRHRRFVWSWARPAQDLARPLWAVVWSATHLLTSEDVARVRTCANEDCGWLFVDRSRRRNRRWCDMSECGSREKARRYYHRKRARGSLRG